MKMEEEKMDLIVGVDFGMTCTGKTTSSITPSLLGGFFAPDELGLTVHLEMDKYQKAPLDLAKLLQQLTRNLSLRGILYKSVDWLQYRPMDSALARKGTCKREQSPNGPCLPKKHNPRPGGTVFVGVPLRDCSRAEQRP